MDTTREKSRTYEEIRDKYFYLVYRIHERYGLDEEGLSELTIRYCEFIHENLHREWQWSGRLQRTLERRAEKILKDRELEDVPELVSFQEIVGAPEEVTVQALEKVEDACDTAILHRVLSDVLAGLTEQEQSVVKLHFYQKRSLDECAAKYNRSRMRMWQIEAKALRKLRHPTRSRRLRPFLNLSCGGGQPRTREAHEVFQYDIPLTQPKIVATSKPCGPMVTAFQLAGPVRFEVRRAPEDDNQYVIQVSVDGDVQYLRDGSLKLVSLMHASRYPDLLISMWVAEHLSLSGQMPDADGCFKW